MSDATQPPVRLAVLTALIALASLWNTHQWRWTMVAAVPLFIGALIPATSRLPALWLASCLAWVPFLVLGWGRLEDHVYVGVYLSLAVGVALTTEEPRESLRRQARLLVGGVFALATVWKATSFAYWRGDVFRTVLVNDERFDPLLRATPGIDVAGVKAARRQLDAIVDGSLAPAADVVVPSLDRLTMLAMGMTLVTLAIEAVIAVAFLAHDGSRTARLRHPALLAFGLATYPLAPVLGFALVFMVAGLLTAEAPRTQALYLFMGSAALLRILVPALVL